MSPTPLSEALRHSLSFVCTVRAKEGACALIHLMCNTKGPSHSCFQNRLFKTLYPTLAPPLSCDKFSQFDQSQASFKKSCGTVYKCREAEVRGEREGGGCPPHIKENARCMWWMKVETTNTTMTWLMISKATCSHTSNPSDLDEWVVAKDAAELIWYGAAVDTRVGVPSRRDHEDRAFGIS